jgi:hypothetical protein
MNTLCVDKTYMILIIIVIMGMIIYQYFSYQYQLDTLRGQISQEVMTNVPVGVNNAPYKSPDNDTQIIGPSRQGIDTARLLPPVDIIRNIDYQTLNDPLTEPSKRQPRYIFGPLMNTPYFNYPTRGFQDTYSLLAYLVDRKEEKHDDNYIIKLFGRQRYPGSDQYDYYVELKVGGDKIKVPLENKKRELYDGDEVYVELIKKTYTVKTLPDKTLEYNPYY